MWHQDFGQAGHFLIETGWRQNEKNLYEIRIPIWESKFLPSRFFNSEKNV